MRQLSRVMEPSVRTISCYMWMMPWLSAKIPESILRNELGRYFELKEESIGPPDHYLGGKVRKVQLNNGWTQHAHVEAACHLALAP